MIMQELSLNRLTGALPASFADLAAMETCALDDNRLCGPLQPELLLRLLALRRFDLRGNLFQDDADVANTILAGACSRGLAANVCCCVLAVRARRDDGLSSLIIRRRPGCCDARLVAAAVRKCFQSGRKVVVKFGPKRPPPETGNFIRVVRPCNKQQAAPSMAHA
jgi:hypothetical protein